MTVETTSELRRWYPQWVKNHGLPTTLNWGDIISLIDMGEGFPRHEVAAHREDWNAEHSFVSFVHRVSEKLGLPKAWTGTGRAPKSFNGQEELVRKWAKEWLDNLYAVAMHYEPGEWPDCGEEACEQVQ